MTLFSVCSPRLDPRVLVLFGLRVWVGSVQLRLWWSWLEWSVDEWRCGGLVWERDGLVCIAIVVVVSVRAGASFLHWRQWSDFLHLVHLHLN